MCARLSHVPASELSMIASFQSRENVIYRGHGKKKERERTHNEGIRKIRSIKN